MDIYQFEDFRLFLKESFAEKCTLDPKYSHRKLAAAAQFTNPGFFNDVIKGRRTLSEAAMEKILLAFDLKANEAEYFRLLVAYGQCKDGEEKQDLYRQMLFRRNRSTFVKLNPKDSKYYQDYHYPLVRSAVQVMDFHGNYEALAKFFRPSLPVTLVKKCVRDLCEWGLLTQEANGRYIPTYKNQEPTASLSDLVKRLNREWVVQASEALFAFSPKERHISSGLLTLSEASYLEIQKRIEKCREEIFEIAKKEENPDRVMQFNIQYFPRTSISKDK